MFFDAYIEPVAELCKKYKVHRLYLYGSILTPRFNPKSDIDIYVEFHEESPIQASRLSCDLRKLLNRVIDIKTIPPARLKSENKLLIYEGGYDPPVKKMFTFESNDTEVIFRQDKPKVTIALPVWNSQQIAWLSMESFCRQEDAPLFELIIFEEEHPAQCGNEYFFSFGERLKEAGCTRVLYMSCEAKFTLAEKWCYIAREAKGEAFCLCGCDDYYSRHMVRDAHLAIKEGYDYIYDTSAYFYSTRLQMMIVYDEVKDKGLMQCVPTALMKKVKPEAKNSGVDRWVVSRIKPRRKKMNTDLRDIVCTDGFNNISKRDRYYKNIEAPFYPTDLTIYDVLPFDVAQKLHLL
jgi:uncharacterized protein